MSLKTELTTFLKANAGVSAITTDIYPGNAPFIASNPFLVYQKASLNNVSHIGGVTTLNNERVQIDAYAKTSLAAETLAQAVISALNGYRGAMGSINVRTCRIDDGNDEFKDDSNGSQKGTHRRRVDFQIWYT